MPDEFRFLASDARFWGLTDDVPPVERVEFRTDAGAAISALRFGSADPEAIFLHGAGLNAHTFDPTILALGRPALSLDLPGHGHSDWRPGADYLPRALAPDVGAAISALAPAPQVLVGQSLGALTAAAVAGARPELVSALVLVDITPGVRPATDAAAVRDFLAGPRDFADVDEVVDRAIAFGIGTDRALLARGVELNTRTRPDGRIEFRHHLAHLDVPLTLDVPDVAPIWDDLEAFAGPILLVRGTGGIVGDELLDEFRRRLPAAEVLTLEAGHNVQEMQPLALADAVRHTADRTPPAA